MSDNSKLISRERLDVVIVITLTYLSFRLASLLLYGSWLDRAEFFNGGEYSPSLIDFVVNEVVFNCILIAIMVGRLKLSYLLLCLICSVVYFSRTFLILLMFASFLSVNFSMLQKIFFIFFVAVASYALLLLRHAGESIGVDNIILYYVDYPIIGVGRLLVTNVDYNSPFGFFSLIFRPFGFISFMIDYLGQMNGSFSIERYASALLANFVYIPTLGESYNAFGTILFPYVVSYGLHYGALIFVVSIIFYLFSLRLIFSYTCALRIISFILLTGGLFSWCSPFIWISPFLVKLLKIDLKLR